MPKRVVLGMSGGVDSSVAALMLKEAGYEVIGLFMRNWDSTLNRDVLGNQDIDADICPQEQDYQDALKVAKQLSIPLHRVEFIEEYWRDVFTYFLDEYKKGRTPNPDILCNKYIKFDAFFKHGAQFNPDFFAMGHYARVKHDQPVQLLRSLDQDKDQTYFLSQLTSSQLKKVLFPLGDITKSDVRKLAQKHRFVTANKRDSTGICFIGERDFGKFLDNYLPAKPGPIKTLEEDILGKHTGLMHYTIGQRKGLGIGGQQAHSNEPWFVIGKDLKSNTLYVGQGYHHASLYATSCTLDALHFIQPENDFDDVLECTAKFRYRQEDERVKVIKGATTTVEFFRPVRAVTPGQACVLYQGDVCLGGGFINKVYQENKLLPY